MTNRLSVAVLGLGAMGAAIARNIVAAGFPVTVWNRTPARARGISGAQFAATPAAACARADVAVSMLADDRAVEEVVFAADGMIGALRPGSCHVGMSTISVALARRLMAAHEAAGQRYVAAPVFGRPEAAAARQLWVVAGGADADIERVAPILEAIGQGTFRVGDAPQASLAKLLGNFLIAASIEMLGEALATAEKAGLEPQRFLDLLTGTLFGAPVIKRYGQIVADTAFEPAGFRLPLGLKDLGLVLDAGEELRAPLPLASLIQARLLTALARDRGHYDWSGLASVIREEVGLPPTRSTMSSGRRSQ
ncbi:MAG TPA: NAD(P)-dependent oxidoreductase [Gemmatimonadales bacterium]|jgi:3-hydroxyisobutyrate dehydrogenase-like beta-hydroxyacid dehydrogenase|nr:NAD(P)-dependent oxidoreductase [Gemmatimonadales bacterium]